MEIDVKIGERGKLERFKQVYTKEFLEHRGYHSYLEPSVFSNNQTITCQSLKTKHGEMIAHNDDVVTYVGHGIWSVSKNDNKNN